MNWSIIKVGQNLLKKANKIGLFIFCEKKKYRFKSPKLVKTNIEI